MGEAIGQTLSMAVGVALSPLPIIAVILMLVTPRARSNGPAFVLGWLIGLGIVGAIMLGIAGPADANENGEPATWASVLELVLGLLLLLLAVKQWRGRPHEGEQAPAPKWMGAIEQFTPVKALGAGVLLSGLNPKNLLLAIGAAATIAQIDISGGEQAVAYAVFAIIGTVGVAVPVAMYFLLGDRAGPLLERLKGWMAAHNAVIMTVLFLVLGAKLLGQGVAGLSS
jgi:hypothetical protein